MLMSVYLLQSSHQKLLAYSADMLKRKMKQYQGTEVMIKKGQFSCHWGDIQLPRRLKKNSVKRNYPKESFRWPLNLGLNGLGALLTYLPASKLQKLLTTNPIVASSRSWHMAPDSFMKSLLNFYSDAYFHILRSFLY